MFDLPESVYKNCSVCGRAFPRDGTRKTTCSEECDRERVRENARRQCAKRKQQRREKPEPMMQCKICKKVVVRNSNNQVYCSNPQCKEVGLQQAIERQRKRRELICKVKVEEA